MKIQPLNSESPNHYTNVLFYYAVLHSNIHNGWPPQESIEVVTAAGFRHLDMSFAFEATTTISHGATLFFSDAWRGWYEGMRTLAHAHQADFTQTNNLVFNYYDFSPQALTFYPWWSVPSRQRQY